MNGGYAVNKSILPFLAILVLILFSAPVRAAICSTSGSWSSFNYNFPVGSYSVSASDLPGTPIFSTGLVNSGWGSGSLTCNFAAQRYWQPNGLILSSIGMTQVYNTNLQGVGVYIRIIRGDGNNVVLPFNEPFASPVVIGPNGPRIQVDLIKTANVVEAGLINMGLIYQEDARDSLDPNPTVMTTINLNNVTIVTSGCSVATQSLSIPVSLGLTPQTDFTGVDTFSQSIPFNIELVDCPPTTNNVKITLSDTSGGLSPNKPGVLALIPGGATGVGIQLLDATNTPITLDAEWGVGETAGTNFLFQLKARYYQTETTMTNGPANSTANFTMTYD
ncbi:MAG: fimbrial protein [Yersinia sp. (in: enterobacteria)]